MFGFGEKKNEFNDPYTSDINDIVVPWDDEASKEGSTLGAFAKTLTRVPENIVASGIQAVQGVQGASVADRGIGDRFVNWVGERNKALSKEYEGTGDFVPGLITKQDVAELGPNLAFSAASLGASFAGGAAGAATPIPGATVAGFMGGGALAAHRMQSYSAMNDWLNKKNEESLKLFNRPINPEEEKAFKDQFEKLASESGLWEAGPEAVGNALEVALLFGKKALGGKANVIPDKAIKSIAGKVGTAAAKLAGILAVEGGTETITQMGQQRVESEAGILTNEAPRQWNNPEDWLKSALEVMPQVILLSGVMGAGGAAYNKFSRTTDKASQAVDAGLSDPNLKEQVDFINAGVQDETAAELKAKEDISAIAEVQPIPETLSTEPTAKVAEVAPVVDEEAVKAQEEFAARMAETEPLTPAETMFRKLGAKNPDQLIAMADNGVVGAQKEVERLGLNKQAEGVIPDGKKEGETKESTSPRKEGEKEIIKEGIKNEEKAQALQPIEQAALTGAVPDVVTGGAPELTPIEKLKEKNKAVSDKKESIKKQAFNDWMNNKAYIDNAGNYRIPREGSKRGNVAAWNKEIKKEFPKPEDFMAAAREMAPKEVTSIKQAPSTPPNPPPTSVALKEGASQQAAPETVDGKGVAEKQPWEMKREEYIKSKPAGDKIREEIRLPKSDKTSAVIIKNATASDLDMMRREYKERYPNEKVSSPKIRKTIDEKGNTYEWMSGEATHSQVEDLILEKRGLKSNQNEDYFRDTHSRVVRKALFDGKQIPPAVLAEYPDLQAKVLPEKAAPEKPQEKVKRIIKEKKSEPKGTEGKDRTAKANININMGQYDGVSNDSGLRRERGTDKEVSGVSKPEPRHQYSEIDKLIEAAPDTKSQIQITKRENSSKWDVTFPVERMSTTADGKSGQKYQSTETNSFNTKEKAVDYANRRGPDKYGKDVQRITIISPNGATYKVWNTKETLSTFKSKVEKMFPGKKGITFFAGEWGVWDINNEVRQLWKNKFEEKERELKRVETKNRDEGTDSNTRRIGERSDISPDSGLQYRRLLDEQMQGLSTELERKKWSGVGYSSDFESTVEYAVAAEHFRKLGFETVPITEVEWNGAVNPKNKIVFLGAAKGDRLVYTIAHETSHILSAQGNKQINAIKDKINIKHPIAQEIKEKLNKSDSYVREEIAATIVGGDNFLSITMRGSEIENKKLVNAARETITALSSPYIQETGETFYGEKLPYTDNLNAKPPPMTASDTEVKDYITKKIDGYTAKLVEYWNEYWNQKANIQKKSTDLGTLHKFFQTVEFFKHPVLHRIYELASHDRDDKYHDLMRKVLNNDGADPDVQKIVTELKKNNPEGYKKLEQLGIYGDVIYRKPKQEENESKADYRKRVLEDFLSREIPKRKLTPDVVEAYKAKRASYDRGIDIYEARLEEHQKQIEDLTPSKKKLTKIQEALKVIKEELKNIREAPGLYEPREWEHGSHVMYGTLGTRHIRREGSLEKLAIERVNLKKEGWTMDEIKENARLGEDVMGGINMLNMSQVIAQSLDRLKKKETDKGWYSGQEVEDRTEELDELSMAYLEAFADTIKARGYRRSSIGRGNIHYEGYVTDPLERSLRYANNLSGGISKAEMSRQMYKEILGEYKDGKRVGGIDARTEPNAYDFAKKYMSFQLRNTDKTDRILGAAKSLATVTFLGGSLRSVAVNATALLTTVPANIMRSVYNYKGSYWEINKELVNSFKDAANYLWTGKANDAKTQAILDEIEQKNYANEQFTRDAMGAMQGVRGRAWNKVVGWAMYLFGVSEKMNRIATMLAAYRLGIEANQNHDTALQNARDASDSAHGVYGKSTLPYVALGTDLGARVFQMSYLYFKFGHTYLQNLYRMGFGKERNLKATLYMLAAPMIIGGAGAFPLGEPILAFVNRVLGWMGIKTKADKFVWDTTREILGEPAEKAGRLGIAGLLGLDISGSFGIGSIPKSLTEAVGPLGGLWKNWGDALDFMNSGQYQKAGEKVSPAFVSNLLKAERESRTGYTTEKGNTVFDEQGRPAKPSVSDTAFRALGFQSTDKSILSERTREGEERDKLWEDARKKIYLQARLYAVDKKNKDLKQTMDMMKEYNMQRHESGLDVGNIVPHVTLKGIFEQVKKQTQVNKKQRKIMT